MLVNARCVVGTLCLLLLNAGVHGFQDAGNYRLSNLRVRNNRRQLLPTPERTTTTTAAAPTSSSTEAPPSTSSVPTPTSSSTPSSTPPSSTPGSTSTPKPVVTSAVQTTNDEGDIVTQVVTVTASSATPSATSNSGNSEGEHSSSSKATFIGLGVAGGVAVVGLIGFIVWKTAQKKKFEQFDNDEGGEINWPMPKEQLQAPAAPSMTAATNATSSSVDLTRDPYAVPPISSNSMMPYRDDPSGTAAAAYYDPYRGPVPHTFQSPPPSSDGHAMYGEAIPMSTYSSGRQSPGPNMGGAYADPYNRSRSPGPNMAFEDPYAAGRRSPGPAMALGMNDPLARVGTPTSMVAGVPPPRMGTPVGAGYGIPPPGLDIPRTGTPQGMYGPGYGRVSPAPPQAFVTQSPVDPYGRRTPNPYGP